MKSKNAEIVELLYQTGQQGCHRGAQGQKKRPKVTRVRPKESDADSKKDPETTEHNLNGKTQ